MIDYFLTVLGQIVSMFLMCAVGFALCKFKLLSEKGIKEMTVLLLKVVSPLILISSFQREFEKEVFIEWLWAFAAALICYVVFILMAKLFYRDKTKRGFAESKMAVVFPNNGFMAFPLVLALVGSSYGIFLASANIVIFNILLWTYGIKLIKPDEKLNLKSLLTNPGIIGVVGGLLLFVSPVKLPEPIFAAVDAIGSLNTPVAMIILGALVARTDLKQAFKNLSIYRLSFIKLIIAPLIMMLIYMFLPLPKTVQLVAFVGAVTPSATGVSMLAQLFDGDYKYATSAVVITTVLSAITMPIILAIGKVTLGY